MARRYRLVLPWSDSQADTLGLVEAFTGNPTRLAVRVVTWDAATHALSFVLDSPVAGAFDATVFDVLGRARLESRSVTESGVHRVIVPTGPLRAGVYFVRIGLAGSRATGRFVVIP